MSNYVVRGPNFTGFFSSNTGEIALNHMFFLFWVSPSVPDIYGRIWSCPKSRRIVHVLHSQFSSFFWGGGKCSDLDYEIEHTSTWQSFTAIGRVSWEISWRNKQEIWANAHETRHSISL